MNRSIRVLLAVIMTLGLALGPAGSIRLAAAETTVITLTIGNPNITVNGTPRAINACSAGPWAAGVAQMNAASGRISSNMRSTLS